MPSLLWQNAKFCLRNMARLSRYSDNGMFQTLATHFGVVWFVVTVWRQQTLIFIACGLLVGISGFAYDQIAEPSSDSKHIVALITTWGGFGVSIAATFWQVLNLHKSRSFGDDQTQRQTLSRRFFIEPPPDGSKPIHLTISDLVSSDPDVPILTVGRRDRPINRAAVDLRVSRALMGNQTIRLHKAPDGTVFHGSWRDILANSDQTAKSDQIEALQIMRREAI